MYLRKKDFDVVEKEKLIFLNEDVFKKIYSIEKILASFYKRQDDENLLFLFDYLNEILEDLEEYKVGYYPNIPVIELNHV